MPNSQSFTRRLCIASFKKTSPAKVFKLGDVLLLALSGKLTFISQGIGIIR